MTLAQIAQFDQAVEQAGEHGWEAIVLVCIIASTFTLIGWLVKFWITQASMREDNNLKASLAREERLSTRITELEKVMTEQLLTALSHSTQAIERASATMSELINTLNSSRPCFFSQDRQAAVAAIMAETIASKIDRE